MGSSETTPTFSRPRAAILLCGVMLTMVVALGLPPLLESNLGVFPPVAAGVLVLVVAVGAARRAASAQASDELTGRWAALYFPALTLAASLAATTAVVLYSRAETEAISHAEFEHVVRRITCEVDRRTHSPVRVLRAARAFVDQSQFVSPAEFRDFLEDSELDRECPGLLACGLLRHVARADAASLVASERTGGVPDFSLLSAGEADDLFVVTRAAGNQPELFPLGLDHAADRQRGEAIAEAIRTDSAVVLSIADSTGPSPTASQCIYYLPIWTHRLSGDADPDDRCELWGIAAAVVSPHHLLADLPLMADGEADVSIRESSADGGTILLVPDPRHPDDAALPRFAEAAVVPTAGSLWHLAISSTPAFEQAHAHPLVLMTASIGALCSVLLALALWMLRWTRRRAQAMAVEMTGQLRTAQAATESSLRELASLWSGIATHTIYSVSDRTGRIIEVNDAFCHSSGYSRDELLGRDHRTVSSHFHPASFWEEAWRSLRAGKPWRGEVCNRRKDGSLFWVDSLITPFAGTDGRIEKYVAIRFDITARKFADREIAEREHRLRTLTDAVPAMMWLSDEQGDRFEFSRAWLDFTGLPIEDVRGDLWKSAIHQEDRPRFARIYQECASLRRQFSVLYRMRRADGIYRWVEDRGAPRYGPIGEFVGYAGSCLDITDQLDSERTILDQADRLALIVRAARLGTWEWDIVSGAVQFNELWCQMLGFRQHDIAPHVESWRKLVHAEDQATVDAELDRHLAGRSDEYRCEHRLRRKDGSWAWVLVVGRVTERSAAGAPLRAVGIHVDITAAKQAERALAAATEEAQAANRAKSEFLANMSHEIRTPMTAILGYAELLREEFEVQSASPETMARIETIRSAGQYLLAIINDILDLSKIEAGKLSLESVETPLVRVLREIDCLVRPRAVSKKLEFATVLTGPVPDRMVTDPTRLRQLLMNLAGNAVKFTESGSVRVEVGTTGPEDARRLVIEVLDTGPGITAEQASRLFTPFTQADSTVTRRHGGTGLGLAISRRLAELMGGNLQLARSEPGAGSCFRLELPLVVAPGATLASSLEAVSDDAPATLGTVPAPTAARLRGRILLAEDGLDNQRLIALHLRKAGAEVDVADNGRIALELLEKAQREERPYDLLVSDMQMPEMDGYTLARVLRGRGNRIPIVALTAHAMSDDRAKCLDAGCDDYATKPIERAKLIRTCAVWLGPAEPSQRLAA